MSLTAAKFSQKGAGAVSRGGNLGQQPRESNDSFFLDFASKRGPHEVNRAEGPLPKMDHNQANRGANGSGRGQHRGGGGVAVGAVVGVGLVDRSLGRRLESRGSGGALDGIVWAVSKPYLQWTSRCVLNKDCWVPWMRIVEWPQKGLFKPVQKNMRKTWKHKNVVFDSETNKNTFELLHKSKRIWLWPQPSYV